MTFQANCIGGRNEKAVREFLEKNWTQGLSEQDAVKLTIKALLEVVDSGSKNMEIAVVLPNEPLKVRYILSSQVIFIYVVHCIDNTRRCCSSYHIRNREGARRGEENGSRTN